MRFFLAALLLSLVLATHAFASSPTINGSATSAGFQGGSTSNTLLQTCSAGDLVMLGAHITKQGSYATGTTSGGGLTWIMISRVQNTAATTFNNVEFWYAYDPSGITGATLTYTASAATDATEFTSWCVSGANSTTPLDPHGSLPATSTAATYSLTFSTSNANDLIFQVIGDSGNDWNDGQRPAGTTSLVDAVNGSGASRYGHVHILYESVSSAQSSVTSAYGGGCCFALEIPGAILHAATADSGGGGGASAGSLGLRGVGH